MNIYNKHGVPIWAIKRALICRINLHNHFKTFSIDSEGNIFLNNEIASHVDLVKWQKNLESCFIPFVVNF